MSRTVIDGCAVVTMDADRTEHAVGHVVVEGARITAVGAGPAPRDLDDATYVDGRGCLATPGLVNTHHHLYQWLTRGFAVDHTLFEWLTTLYPVWACLDEDTVRTGATGALAQLARTGCTTTMDHHYVFPADGGDLLGAEIEAARTVGLRFLPTRGSMDLGQSRGGLPPDHVVEEIDAILDATAAAIDRHHDPSPDSMLRIGVAPCSPFSVTGDLLEQAAKLARDKGVRLHTHLAETDDEEAFCRERFGCSPVEYVESLGWLGPDVWLAHGVHLDDPAIAALAASGTGVAHCPSSNARLGAGICRTRDLRDAGRPGRPRRRRRRVQRGGVAGRGAAALGAVRPGRRRPAGAHRPRRPGDGHPRRRPGAGLGRPDRLAGAGQAGRPRALAPRHRRPRQHPRPGRRARARLGRRPSSCCWCRAARWSAATRW